MITPKSKAYNFTNEGGAYGTIRLLKNVAGMWLAQECRRSWAAQGQDYSWDDMTRLAAGADPFRSFVDPDHLDFLNPEDMPTAIQVFCEQDRAANPRKPCRHAALYLRKPGAEIPLGDRLPGRNVGVRAWRSSTSLGVGLRTDCSASGRLTQLENPLLRDRWKPPRLGMLWCRRFLWGIWILWQKGGNWWRNLSPWKLMNPRS